jgi:DMSO/TMAO reductase YedYZ molybdopterin-dependent catalytic subunit
MVVILKRKPRGVSWGYEKISEYDNGDLDCGPPYREPRTDLELSDGGTVEVTPLEDMRVRTAESTPPIDLSEYLLTVTGLVNAPLSLAFDDLQGFEPQERLVDLPCVEGWTEAALWKGPRLAELLEKAGLLEEADNVVFSSPGGYTTSLTIDDIRETDPLLAYEVNGEALPEEQGFPVRLVVPDRLGYKWIKWITAIEVISGEYEGYWESRGYSNEADASGR